jgi:hypothetical protein
MSQAVATAGLRVCLCCDGDLALADSPYCAECEQDLRWRMSLVEAAARANASRRGERNEGIRFRDTFWCRWLVSFGLTIVTAAAMVLLVLAWKGLL